MRITFRFTDSEYRQFRRLNRTDTTPHWKRYLLALLCLLPSFFLILGTKSLIAILAAATILISVLVIAIAAAVGDKTVVDKHDHVMTFDQLTALESHSYSRCESHWDYYDSFEQNESFYLLRRLDRFTAIPKRVIQDSQLDEFTTYCKQIGNEAGPGSEIKSAVPLFNEFFTTSNQFEIFQFAYQADDLTAAMSEQLQLVDLSNNRVSSDSTNGKNSKPMPRQAVLGTFWLVVFGVVLLFVISGLGQIPPSQQWTLWQFACVVLAIILPFKLMKWLNLWFRARQKKRAPVRVPNQPISMRLMPSGWAIGNPQGCQFFDWRDVEAFYQNRFCLGFHTSNDLVQVIPRRIFSTQDASQQFLDRAVSLRREHLRSFAPTAVAVETGNPYQAPTS